MKIPEPIIDPTTIMVESNKPSPRTNPDDSVSVTIGSITSVDVGSDIAPLLFNSLGAPISRLASSKPANREIGVPRLQSRLFATLPMPPLRDTAGRARRDLPYKSNRAPPQVSRPPRH